MKLVKAAGFDGWRFSIAQLWGSGPKFTIDCGNCRGHFKKRIPMVDEPGVQCPYCKAINKLPLTVTR